MQTLAVSFFGHRSIENVLEVENRLERLIQAMLRNKEYIEFLVGRDGEFDQLVSSTIRRCKREYRSDNSAHIWVLPYLTAEFRDNEESFRDYYDEIEVCEAAAGSHYKKCPPDPKSDHGGQIGFGCVLHPARKRRRMADHEIRKEAVCSLYQHCRSKGGCRMKKCILSAIAGALTMLVVIIIAVRISAAQKLTQKGYEHIDYVSTITQEECFVCGTRSDTLASLYWGQDNVGIVNLNTFELLYLEINRYDDQGNLIKEPAGYMSSNGLIDKEEETYVHAYSHPDNAYADVHITGVKYAIDRDSVQNHLCQTCLDSINEMWFTDQPPAEYAIVSFEERTIRPLLNAYPWFSAGNYGIDCDFKDDGTIDLLIHYIKLGY